MTVKDFFTYYNLEETNVLSLKTSHKDLLLDLEADVYMEFTGNQVRTDFDCSYFHRYTFPNVPLKEPLFLESPIAISSYTYQNGVLSFMANGRKIVIPETNVSVKANIRKKIDNSL